MERAAEAYGIANSTAWDLVGKHEAGGLEALTPAKAGGARSGPPGSLGPPPLALGI